MTSVDYLIHLGGGIVATPRSNGVPAGSIHLRNSFLNLKPYFFFKPLYLFVFPPPKNILPNVMNCKH